MPDIESETGTISLADRVLDAMTVGHWYRPMDLAEQMGVRRKRVQAALETLLLRTNKRVERSDAPARWRRIA